MKRLLTLLLTAMCMLQGIMALEIDKDKFYTMSNRNDNNLYVKDTGVDILQLGNGVDNNSYWRFIPSGNPNCYYVQNLNTGRYAQACAQQQEINILMGTEPVEYKILLCSAEGTDCYGLASTNLSNTEFTSGCIGWNWKGDNTVQTYPAAVGTNHRSFWKFTEANPPSCLIGSHNFVNGICSECGTVQKDYVNKNENGFYELNNSLHVEWFSALVNEGNIEACAVLLNDIDFTGIAHTPIGNSTGHKFNGTFDGQGHRIKNLIMDDSNAENIGFFGFLRGNAGNTIVRNLIIDKSCSFTAMNKVAAITGSSQGSGGLITLENLVNEADVTAVTGTDAAAFIGSQQDSSPLWIVRNCVNTGKITANGYAGAVAGWMGNNEGNIIENIINLGVIEGFNVPYNMGRFSGNVTGLVDLSGTEGAEQGIVDLTQEDIVNGKLTFYMNGNQQQIRFYQTLGQDSYPLPFSSSKQVFFTGKVKCNGEPISEGIYTNEVQEGNIAVHTFEQGKYYCVVCGALNENFCEQTDGFYQLNNATDLRWFAAFVNNGHTDANASLNVDVDLNNDYFEGIGTFSLGYKGTFDGHYHTISNLDMSAETHDWCGFFNFLNGGAVIQNLLLDESCVICGGKGTALVGGCSKPGNVLLRNLANEGKVTSYTTCAGAILGANYQSIANLTVENCYSTGIISGASESAAIVGWLGNNSRVMRNCWTSASATGIDGDGAYAARHQNGSLTNIFSFNGTQGKRFDLDEIESGSLTYRLNADADTVTWFQNIDNGKNADICPTFDPSHGIVYPVADRLCDGSFDADAATYSNTDTSVIPAHSFKEGFCSVCGQEDPDYPFLHVFANADHDTNTGYTNMQSNDGSGLAINNSVAEHWNQQWFDTYQIITGLKKGFYKLRVQGYSRVCQWDDVVYANGELQEEYVALYHNSQYYAEVNGKMIANRFMDITAGKKEQSVGETENYSEETGCYVPNSLAAARKYFAKGGYWNNPLYIPISGEQDTIKVGVQNNMYMYGNWTVWDTWRLEYIGEWNEENTALLKAQQTASVQDISSLVGQTALKEGYDDATKNMLPASTLEEIMEYADIMARYPQQIRKSHIAYQNYETAIDDIRKQTDEREDLNGEYADMLYTYLNEYEEPNNELPHGSYDYIMDMLELDENQLQEEIEFVQNILSQAIKNSISVGSDLTNLIYNPGFDEDGNFKGWNTEVLKRGTGGDNFNSNTGFTDIYPVAGSWNTAFTVWQDLQDVLPDGIYELEAPAFNRPGDNGQGDYGGNDLVNSDLFINDYHTPVMNIYKGQVLYADAINGVNCRYDAVGDPTAPHNGEQTSSQDTDTGEGYVPEQRYAMSFAFNAGRYVNHAYAIVTGGHLRIGIRNTGEPWYEKGVTCWGKFKLRYQGKSETAMEAMTENFRTRLDNLVYACSEQNYYFSQEHTARIETLLQLVESESEVDKRMQLLKEVNDAFNTISESHGLYMQLVELMDYCYAEGSAEGISEEESEKFFAVAEEILEKLYTPNLTDAEIREYYYSVLNNTEIGGGLFVQGDLVDTEGNNLSYAEKNTVYQLKHIGNNVYTGTFKTQNRANKMNADNRAGIFFTRMFDTFRAADAYSRFVTPATTDFQLTGTGGADFQMTGGEFNVTIDLENGSVQFEPISYNWNDKVYVCGSILNNQGEPHRWKNDEMAPLAHQGNGIYEGIVWFSEDYNYPGYATFTIMSCRSTEENIAYSTTTRLGWQEGRYGSATDETVLNIGETVGNLLRNADRKWKFAWEGDAASAFYVVRFDMNMNTILIYKEDDEDGVENVNGKGYVNGNNNAIYDLSGRKIASKLSHLNSHLKKGIYIVNGKKIVKQ